MMPTDYVAKIQKLDKVGLVSMLAQIRAGANPSGWARGKAFEHLILRAFEIEGAEVVWPFEVRHGHLPLEQIDGVVYSHGIGCLIEAKDYKDRIAIEPVAKLRSQLMRRPPGAIGIIFGRSDFTEPMKELTRMMNPLQVLLWEIEELDYALNHTGMRAALQLKYRRALEYGMPDYNVKGKL
jgi:hypothetical protein